MRDLFLLDPTVTFLNHGSFGATPRVVFETYQRWQLELERQPVEFLGRRHDCLLDDARARLAEYLHVPDVDNLVYVMNATWGVNVVARSIMLQPGDEILSTNHEYGACVNAWHHTCDRTGATWIQADIPLPLPSDEEIVEIVWSRVTPRTKVLYLSHITSSTASTFPVAALCKRAREAGILSVIDGAHAPGQIPLDLAALDPDIYTGNPHKWLCSPKGSGFLYARPEHHPWMHALVISWGYGDPASAGWGMGAPDAPLLVARHQYQGTRDIAAFLSVPAAIDFQREHDWESVRARCHALAVEAQRSVIDLTGIPAPVPPDHFAQMALCEMPASVDLPTLKRRLYDEHRVEVPVIAWNGRKFIRVSVQGYNTPVDIDTLLSALKAVISTQNVRIDAG